MLGLALYGSQSVNYESVRVSRFYAGDTSAADDYDRSAEIIA